MFSFASVVSLLLCTALAGLWVSGEFRDLCITRVAWPRSYFGCHVVGGRAYAWWVAQPMTDRPQGWHVTWESPDTSLWRQFYPSNSAADDEADTFYQQFAGPSGWRAAGFGAGRWNGIAGDGLPYRDFSLIAPLWGLIALTACLPLAWVGIWFRKRFRAKASLQNFCAVCGYDLRASKERCPECGTPIRQLTL
jgi:hypothetical protein